MYLILSFEFLKKIYRHYKKRRFRYSLELEYAQELMKSVKCDESKRENPISQINYKWEYLQKLNARKY